MGSEAVDCLAGNERIAVAWFRVAVLLEPASAGAAPTDKMRAAIREGDRDFATALWIRTPCACLAGPDMSSRWSSAKELGNGVPKVRVGFSKPQHKMKHL